MRYWSAFSQRLTDHSLFFFFFSKKRHPSYYPSWEADLPGVRGLILRKNTRWAVLNLVGSIWSPSHHSWLRAGSSISPHTWAFLVCGGMYLGGSNMLFLLQQGYTWQSPLLLVCYNLGGDGYHQQNSMFRWGIWEHRMTWMNAQPAVWRPCRGGSWPENTKSNWTWGRKTKV